jgi:hypothetical protein
VISHPLPIVPFGVVWLKVHNRAALPFREIRDAPSGKAVRIVGNRKHGSFFELWWNRAAKVGASAVSVGEVNAA